MSNLGYLDFEIEIGSRIGGREYPLAVIRSPGGEARELLLFPFDELALESRLKDLQIALLRSGGKRRHALTREEQTVRDFGEKLFAALMTGEVRSRYDVSRQDAARQGKGLRIKLRIQPPELASLPWEFLYDSRAGEYICLSTQTPLVRYIERPQVIQPLAVVPPLNILGVTASPRDLPGLDIENEKLRVERALEGLIEHRQVRLTWQDHATWRDLQYLMRPSQGPWHILQFIGHGGFEHGSDEGFILLENENGESHFLTATLLGRLIADHASLRLAILNSCGGAQGGDTDIFSSTASLLVRRGLPAVLAMQYEITDRAAIEFSRGFYEAIAEGLPVDAATTEARKSVSLGLNNTIEWGTPVLHMRTPDGVLFRQLSPVEAQPLATAQPTREKAEVEREASVGDIAILGDRERALEEASEKAHPGDSLRDQQTTFFKRIVQQRPLFWWAVIIVVGLGVIGAGAWGISNLSTFMSANTTPAMTTPNPSVAATQVTNNQIVLAGTGVPAHPQKITSENAAHVEQLARWGKGGVYQAIYSPDGEILAAASSIGVFLYDANNLEQLGFIDTGSWVNSMAFSPDGQTLASGLEDNTIRLWRLSDGQPLQTLVGHTSYVYCVAFSPDGRTLASGSPDFTIRLWRLSDGQLLQTLVGHNDTVSSVAFSPDGQTLASGSFDKTIRLWRLSDGQLLQSLAGHTYGVYSVAFSPDGQTLASSSGDKTIRLWRLSDGQQLQTLVGHTSYVFCVAFSPDGRTLASGSFDKTIRLWRVSDGQLLSILEGHIGSVTSVAFSPDGQSLASSASDATIRLWRTSDGQLLQTLIGHTSYVWNVAFSPDGQTLAFSPTNITICLWRTSDGQLLQTLEEYVGTVYSLAFSPDGQTLASGTFDNAIHLWRLSDGQLLQPLIGHTSYVRSVAFSPDGQTLASGSDDNTIRLWRLSDGQPLQSLAGHTDSVYSVAFSPDGQTLASGSADNTIRLWRASDGQPLQTLVGHSSTVWNVAFSPDGQTLASGSDDNTIRLWRLSDGQLLQTFAGHTDSVYSVAFSPDGQTLASGSADNTIRLWHLNDGQLLQTLAGHTSSVSSVAFSPDGRTLASGSFDATVRLWGIVP